MTTTNTEESDWIRNIQICFAENLNLYAEFELNSSHCVCKDYHPYTPFKIYKDKLLLYIKKFMDGQFKNIQYNVFTRTKDDSSHYYIIVSITQNNPIQTVAVSIEPNVVK